MACKTAQWRGVRVCAHMVPKLNAWAKAVGQDILLKPLSGCGSYQTSTAASAGTHAGGGAIDIDLGKYNNEQCRRVETEGRRVLNLAYHRTSTQGPWSAHAHVLDPECPHLSGPAAAQFPLYQSGLNALANNGADTGNRAFVKATMAAFRKRKVPDAGSYKVRSGDTLSSIFSRVGVSVANLVAWNRIQDQDVISVGQVLRLTPPAKPK